MKEAVRVYGCKARMMAGEHTERSSFWTIGLGFVCVEHGTPTGGLIQGRRQAWFDRKGGVLRGFEFQNAKSASGTRLHNSASAEFDCRVGECKVGPK